MIKRMALVAIGLAFGVTLAVRAAAPATQPATTAPAKIPAMYANRTPHEKPKAGEVRAFTVKELGNFDYDPDVGGPVPDDVKALSGMKVKVSGFMMLLGQSDNITEFALVPSLTSCCFGQPPGVQHIITVHCPKNKVPTVYIDPVVVEGTLKVDVQREDNYTVNIFDILDATVKPIELNLSREVLQGSANFQPKVDVKN